jgi:hypothetical protein
LKFFGRTSFDPDSENSTIQPLPPSSGRISRR